MAAEADTLKGEVWKPIVGLEGRYEVSSLGRVRSLPAWVRPRASGEYTRYLRPGRVLRPYTAHHGYQKFVGSIDGKQVRRLVHRAVCEAFHGPCPDGHQASHRNGVSSDNRPENLRWLSVQENADEKAIHGTVTRGDTHPKSKLSPEMVRHIRKRREAGEAMNRIARDIGVSVPCVQGVIWRRTWAWVE